MLNQRDEVLRTEILEKFYLSLFREEKKETKERSIPVTGLIYECLRRCVYSIIIPEPLLDTRGSIRVWIGRKLHETPIFVNGEHELEILWTPEGGAIPIKGRIDELWGNLLIEKKTTRRIPSRPREHHVRQLEYYRVLLAKNGREVRRAAVIYVDVDSCRAQVYLVDFARSVNEVEKEMIEKYKVITKSLETGILPPRIVRAWETGGMTTVCEYCPYFGICMTEEDERGEIWIK